MTGHIARYGVRYLHRRAAGRWRPRTNRYLIATCTGVQPVDSIVMIPCCSLEVHEAIKIDHTRWNALPIIGYDRWEAFEDEPAGANELRNCTCGATLALEVK